jgi:hypothetical protein
MAHILLCVLLLTYKHFQLPLLNVPPCPHLHLSWTHSRPRSLPSGTKKQFKGTILTTRTPSRRPRERSPKRSPRAPPAPLPNPKRAASRLRRWASGQRRGPPPQQLPRKRPLRLARWRSQSPEMLHLRPSRLHPLPARANLRELASIRPSLNRLPPTVKLRRWWRQQQQQ